MFIDSLQCLSSSLDDLDKDLIKDDLKYLSLQFLSVLFDIVRQKEYMKYMDTLENCKEGLSSKAN